jgi:UDP-glucose 4-epimerase
MEVNGSILPPWPEFSLTLCGNNNNQSCTMKVFIAGGAGYIGNELIVNLLRNNSVENIVVYDNLGRKNYNLFLDKRIDTDKIRFINGNILDAPRLKDALANIDVVYHLAGVVQDATTREKPHLFEQVNQWGTAELARMAKNANVKKFVYLSSDSVYGFSDSPIDSSSVADPRSLYAVSKYQGERYVSNLAGVMDYYILRCANIYGYSPSVRFEPLINRFMFEVNYLGRVQIKGNGLQKRSFIHVDYVVNILGNLLDQHESLDSGIYNLVDKVLTIREISDAVKEIYPFAEMSFSMREQPYRNRMLKSDLRINNFRSINPLSLKDELLNFTRKYSFSSPFTSAKKS